MTLAADDLQLELSYDVRVNYALQQNAVPVVKLLRLVHGGAEDLTDLEVKVGTSPRLGATWTARIASVPAGGTYNLPDVDLSLRPEELVASSERQTVTLWAEVWRGDQLIQRIERPLEVLAYNEWSGTEILPEILAAFVLPNHPMVAQVLKRAGERLSEATGRADLDGYQSRDPARVRAMAEAVYGALAVLDLTYVNPPASFEVQGQKVRTPEQVIAERLATCLDLVLLFAACLEQIGLHPLILLTDGHALCGVWLEPETFPEAVVQDPLRVRKRAEIEQIALFETTGVCSSPVVPFADALRKGHGHVTPGDDFLCAIDVRTARRLRIRPLPMRATGYQPVGPVREVEPAPAPDEPTAPEGAPPGPEREPGTPKSRLDRWRRKLLDMSLRNRLLNHVAGKKSVPLAVPSLAELEDALASGARFPVLSLSQIEERGDLRDLERQGPGDARREFLAEELSSRRLYSELPPDELDRRLLEIYRAARVSLEESGANTLYLALGFLQWFETPSSGKARRAPLLLLPMEIERISLAEGYRLTLTDEEPRVNQTLLQKLEGEFGIRVPGLEVLPEDDSGLDVDGILREIRRAIVDVDRWEVLDEVQVGFFSFTKYLMWLDVHERAESLMDNALLRHLVQTPERAFSSDGAFPEAERLDDEWDPAGMFCPKDADSSQLCAVRAATQGRSFVLEGPPGTGKSQTITNLIAQCLADGQRVLFVAEKRAALEVVYRRLSDVGLEPFCLEVHSNKGKKKDVVQQLGRTLELGRQREPSHWRQRAAELQQSRAELNRYVEVIHRRRPVGLSVFQVTARLIALREAPTGVGPDVDDADSWDEARYAELRAAVEALWATADEIGPPVEHPWNGVARTEWHPTLPQELAARLSELQTALAALREVLPPLLEAVALLDDLGDERVSRHQLHQLDALAELLGMGFSPPRDLIAGHGWADSRARIESWIATGRRRDDLRRELFECYHPDLLKLDLDTIRQRYRLYGESFFLWRWLRLRGVRRQLRSVRTKGRIGKAPEVLRDLNLADELRGTEESLVAERDDATELLGVYWRDGNADWEGLEQLCAWVGRIRRLAVELSSDDDGSSVLRASWADLCQRATDSGHVPLLQERARFQGAYREFEKARGAVTALLELDEDTAFATTVAPRWLPAVAARLSRWSDEVPALRHWCAYRRAAASAQRLGLAALVARHADGRLATSELVDAFERSFLDAWLHATMRDEPDLGQFRGLSHARRIDRFRALDREIIELAGAVVRARLAAQMPSTRGSAVESSELGILLREMRKQRRHLPVRKLFTRIPHLLSRLSPCLLMSPLSVAQYLNQNFPPFDLVVFDEASQIPVWDAVGAIGRAQAAVVVGDSKQLPPTAFFLKLDDEETTDDDDFEELESVLDECGAAGLNRLYLRWHYRSRHEHLIAFSNHHYYDNRLLTFPSPLAESDELGVKLVPVAEGVYDRGRSQTNKVEAQTLVAEVVRRLRDPQLSRYTIGIVTFSASQQTLIEDLLEVERRRHPEIEPHFSAAAEEPLFVKNLENVQGDERDAILFSVCYGPNAAGRIYMHFGPLNREGGERRLNVAVTRGRRELVVFSSLRPEQIDLSRTRSLGARHLRAFLDYAERGIDAIAEAVALDPDADFESPFEKAVHDALVGKGWVVHKQVGCSGYRIDLAVVDPRRPGAYLMGVECDGASYHSAATARDRDRLREAVLRRLGWRLQRVWSTDWWIDPDGELRVLDEALQKALREEPAELVEERLPVPEPEPAVEEVRFAAAPGAVTEVEPEPPQAVAGAPAHYPEVPAPRAIGSAEEFYAAGSDMRLGAELAAILAREAPIGFALAARRLSACWGIERLTAKVKDRVRAVVGAAAVTTSEDGAVLWAPGQDPEGYDGIRPPAPGQEHRDAKELPSVEVANAAAHVLAANVALSREDLARETARVFGISRLGKAVRAAMDAGIETLAARGGCVVDGGRVRLP